MFRLLKLAVYAIVGWAIYEFVTGLREERRGGHLGREMEEATSGGKGRSATLTGAGRGTTAQTEEPSGASATHIVGRGAGL